MFEPEKFEGIAQWCATQDGNVGQLRIIHAEFLQSQACERREIGHRSAFEVEVLERQAGQRGEIADTGPVERQRREIRSVKNRQVLESWVLDLYGKTNVRPF